MRKMKIMKYQHIYKFLLILVVGSMTSCEKFLDVKPSSTNVNPSTISDFQEMLNSEQLAICSYFMYDLMSDDVTLLRYERTEPYVNSFLWKKNIWRYGDMDEMYKKSYERILQLNILLTKIDVVKANDSASESAKAVIIAQAKTHRAWYYLQLANIYGMDYTSGTAETSLAVPLVLVPGESVRPKRATVKEVYDQVILDLKDAISTPALPAMGATIIHPGKAAAHTILARAYLYMGQYADALTQANEALKLKNDLVNMKNSSTYTMSLLDQKVNAEVMMAKMGTDEEFYQFYSSSIGADYEFVNTFSWDDKRRNLAFKGYGDTYVVNNSRQTFNYSVAVPEAMLIKAECLARAGQVTEPLALINDIRKNRISNYQPLTATADNILSLVLEERRKELFLHGGLRVFDLKRLNRDPKFQKTLKRIERDIWEGTEILHATLEPNSPRYLMEIAPLIISTNPNIIPNAR